MRVPEVDSGTSCMVRLIKREGCFRLTLSWILTFSWPLFRLGARRTLLVIGGSIMVVDFALSSGFHPWRRLYSLTPWSAIRNAHDCCRILRTLKTQYLLRNSIITTVGWWNSRPRISILPTSQGLLKTCFNNHRIPIHILPSFPILLSQSKWGANKLPLLKIQRPMATENNRVKIGDSTVAEYRGSPGESKSIGARARDRGRWRPTRIPVGQAQLVVGNARNG